MDKYKEQNIKTAIKYVVEQKQNGREHSDLRKELVANGWHEKEVKLILNLADEIYFNNLEKQKKKLLKFNTKIYAYFLILFGVTFTLLSHKGIFSLGNYYIIFYGPIVAGIGLLTYDKRKNTNHRQQKLKSPYNVWQKYRKN